MFYTVTMYISILLCIQIAELARSKQAVEGMKVTMNKAVER